MSDSPREVMQKDVIRKEDGRQLIYYTFRPATAPAAAARPADRDQAPTTQN